MKECKSSRCYSVIEGGVSSIGWNKRFAFIVIDGSKYIINIVSNYSARDEIKIIKKGDIVRIGIVETLEKGTYLIYVLEKFDANV